MKTPGRQEAMIVDSIHLSKLNSMLEKGARVVSVAGVPISGMWISSTLGYKNEAVFLVVIEHPAPDGGPYR